MQQQRMISINRIVLDLGKTRLAKGFEKWLELCVYR